MNFKSLLFVASLTFAAASALADDVIRFVPDVYPIGYVNQGDVKHFTLKGANLTGKEIVLESVFGQGVGMSNFKYPQKIAANSPVTIEFDMDFSNMEGNINPTVVLVDTAGTPYTASLDGIVKVPFLFSEKMFDAGYYSKGEKREWSFYVWGSDKRTRPDLVLNKESSKDFNLKITPVMLNVDKPEKITEGGKVPGVKVSLSTKGLSREGWELKQQSIRKLVGFTSKKFPKSTPEVLVIGFWK